jgi:nucleotide-binding universal stress UspA family protein
MPNYGTPQAGGVLTALYPGDALQLFAAETPAAPQASLAFARACSPDGTDNGTTFQIAYASAPTASLQIQGSNVDADAAYGEPAGELQRYGRAVDLLVLGSHKRSPIGRLLGHGTAQRLADEPPCPLLVVGQD